MDRCAIFVDAGWFLAEAAEAVTGRSARSSVSCDYAELVPALRSIAMQHMQVPLLRAYWYDAAPEGIPNSAHLDIASLPDVKLRLGRISHNEQKGVDALLILDLTTLARERAIVSALVVSGDEDVREGIAMAQSLGVRVTLGCIDMPGRRSLATTLVQEADDVLAIDVGLVRRFVRPHEVEERRPDPVPAGAGVLSAGDGAPGSAWPDVMGGSLAADEPPTPRGFGYRFGARHADTLPSPELRALQRQAPMIPSDLMGQLFREAEQVFGYMRDRPEIRRELKAGFWDHVMQRR
jgi:uncharacterized LabA/DUF88 family protein